jgi:cytochrome c2
MTKLSVILAALGVALLAFSFVPSRTAPVRSTLMPTPIPAQVVAPTPSSAPADIAYGRALFSAKGCVTCHRHAAVPGSGAVSGDDVPNLTTPRWTTEYLRTWLKDPGAVRPNTPMPNLGLKADEIEALIAFLTSS